MRRLTTIATPGYGELLIAEASGSRVISVRSNDVALAGSRVDERREALHPYHNDLMPSCGLSRRGTLTLSGRCLHFRENGVAVDVGQ